MISLSTYHCPISFSQWDLPQFSSHYFQPSWLFKTTTTLWMSIQNAEDVHHQRFRLGVSIIYNQQKIWGSVVELHMGAYIFAWLPYDTCQSSCSRLHYMVLNLATLLIVSNPLQTKDFFLVFWLRRPYIFLSREPCQLSYYYVLALSE